MKAAAQGVSKWSLRLRGKHFLASVQLTMQKLFGGHQFFGGGVF